MSNYKENKAGEKFNKVFVTLKERISGLGWLP